MVQKTDLVIIGITVGIAFGVLIATLLFLGTCWYKRRRQENLSRCANDRSIAAIPIRTNGVDASIDISASLTNPKVIEFSPKHPSNGWWNHRGKDDYKAATGIPRYSYKDLQRATQNFTTVIGEGSFGAVYKASMSVGGVAAVKVLAADSKQGETEFQTEVSLLARLHHRNLVNLVGYCVDKGQRMLIYEFMSNGSLANLLYNEDGKALSWEERLQIALDISHGIEYLHDGAVPAVIHRDLKSANILLDHSMRAKVADFGLSKEAVFDGRNSGIKGTYGYIDPTYIATNKYTMKSDIYSFGVILFELITAIHPHQNLIEYVNLASMSRDGVDEIVDQKIIGTFNPEDMRSLADIAHKCLRKTPKRRPSAAEVSQAILKIKQSIDDTMSLRGEDFSRMLTHIERQQSELTKKGGPDETLVELV